MEQCAKPVSGFSVINTSIYNQCFKVAQSTMNNMMSCSINKPTAELCVYQSRLWNDKPGFKVETERKNERHPHWLSPVTPQAFVKDFKACTCNAHI